MMGLMDDQDQIRKVVTQIDNAWLKGPVDGIPAAIQDCFAEKVVMRGPDFQLLTDSKEECVRSYADFARQATVHQFRQQPHQIDIYASTAVVTSAWEMTYQLGTDVYTEKGSELLVLAKENGRWVVAWRTIFSKAA